MRCLLQLLPPEVLCKLGQSNSHVIRRPLSFPCECVSQQDLIAILDSAAHDGCSKRSNHTDISLLHWARSICESCDDSVPYGKVVQLANFLFLLGLPVPLPTYGPQRHVYSLINCDAGEPQTSGTQQEKQT